MDNGLMYLTLKEKFKLLDLDPIPFNDIDAWVQMPAEYHRFYDKLWITETQGIPCGPMGIYPAEYPVIFKPIINLYGMSRGIQVINDDDEYDTFLKDGFFWSEYLTGVHRCIDCVLVDGKIVFTSSLISTSSARKDGSFDYHSSDPEYSVAPNISEWIEVFLDCYTGCANVETIDDKIIEVHLRLNGDSHLYDEPFMSRLSSVLKGENNTLEYKVPVRHLIPLFVESGYDKEINREGITKLCKEYGVRSLFFNDVHSVYQSEHRARLLIFDIDDLETGLKCREKIIMEYI